MQGERERGGQMLGSTPLEIDDDRGIQHQREANILFLK